MISRSAVSRASQLALRRQACARSQTRGFAATASVASPFQSTDIAGVNVAAKDSQGPTTKLAIVAKAGTRYQPAPGLTAGLEAFAFKNTLKRSALRITRESELLGAQLTSYHTREAVILEASFVREHLPYFTELLAEVISQTKFTSHELTEEVEPVVSLAQEKYTADTQAQALDIVHASAFHTGLGEALYPNSSTHLGSFYGEKGVAAFADAAYARPNFALVGDNATEVALSKWVEVFFKGVPSASSSAVTLSTPASKYYGGQQRAESSAGNSVVIAFPTAGLNAPDAATSVLTALLGGDSSIKWTPGFTALSKLSASIPGATVFAKNLTYSDAGLLTIQISGKASAVRKAAEEAVKVVKSIASGTTSKEDLAKAIAKAKYDALTVEEVSKAGVIAAGTAVIHGLPTFQAADAAKSYESVTAASLSSLAKKLLSGKATYAVVGDLHTLPYAEDIGLTV